MSLQGATLREPSLDRLRLYKFDLLVIGGGIVGARVAFEAAHSGLRVALVDAGDFGGATSSASGKLIHGGLRYLRTGGMRFVREARREQRLLAGRVAPHLVRRLPLLLTAVGHASNRFSTLAAGPLVYWGLGGFRRPAPHLVAAEEARTLIPPLRTAGLGAHVLLEEAVTDDGRLTLSTVKAAVRAGVVAANHLRVVGLERSRAGVCGAVLEGRDGEGLLTIHCRTVVNATGPWIDQLRLLEDPGSRPAVRLSKGVHLVLPLRPRKLRPSADPLPGSSPPDARALRTVLDGTTAGHLIELYGGEADKLLQYATRFPEALEKVHPGGPDVWAQVYHAAAEEWALTADDVVRLRTTLGIRGLDTEEVRARISSLLASCGADLAASRSQQYARR